MNLELNIKLYESASGKQNMWIEKNHDVGTRYEIDTTEDVYKILEKFMNNIGD